MPLLILSELIMAVNTKHRKNKWRVSDNTYMNISDMDDDHIQKAIFFSEHKIVNWTKKGAESALNVNIFKQKREELLEEGKNRGITLESLEDLPTVLI